MKWRPRPRRQTGYRGALVQQPTPEPATQPGVRYTDPRQYHAAPAGPAPPRFTGQDATSRWEIEPNDKPAGYPNKRVGAARLSIDLKAVYFKKKFTDYKIDEAVLAEAVTEAVTHLMGDRDEWEPAGGWAGDPASDRGMPEPPGGWATGLAWYRPEDGDDGMPRRARQPGQVVDVPWPDQDDEHGWLAAYERELGRPA